jgi:CubicO group peptidase (beta-lactamase class C family)
MTPNLAGDRRLRPLERFTQSPICDALQVRTDGVTVFDWATERGQRPIEIMSATKSVTSMLIGRLLTQGLLDTIDRPAADFFPVWKGTEKQLITLRHLLEHTSGLACRRTTEEIYASGDFVRHALDAEVVAAAGTTFTYNNRAVNLLAEVVRQVSGIRMDEYARAALFGPLGIEQWHWALDQRGNPHCMAGLRLRAADLATLGQLMIEEGTWNGEQLLSRDWIRASATPSAANASHGLLWWLLGDQLVVLDDAIVETWRRADPPVCEEFISRLLPLRDRPLDRTEFLATVQGMVGEQQWAEQTWRRGLLDGRLIISRVRALYASGSGGQFLLVMPDEGIVAAHLWAMESPFEDINSLVSVLRELQTR